MTEVPSEWRSDNEGFINPHSFSNKLGRFTWAVVFHLFYKWTPPRFGMPLRRVILRCFGAGIGGLSWIHPSTRIWAPWMLQVGNSSYIDRDCFLYNSYPIEIGDRVIISFGSVLCTVSHDYTSATYPLVGERIVIHDDSWLMAETFICPGVVINTGGVVGARSVVTRPVPDFVLVAGNPARVIKNRFNKTGI
jgi:putative colanic acid biosynthesis acetyltransferase WcaF